jgi:hypothetical protein
MKDMEEATGLKKVIYLEKHFKRCILEIFTYDRKLALSLEKVL